MFRFLRKKCFAILDAADNSVTFSKKLCKKLDVFNLDNARIITFKLAGSELYAFSVNPVLDEDTALSEIQYNSKHRCIGYEALCPTVNRIFYDYGIPAGTICKLSVTPAIIHGQNDSDVHYFIFEKP